MKTEIEGLRNSNKLPNDTRGKLLSKLSGFAHNYSYTEAGIIPRLCKDLFGKVGQDTDVNTQYSVEVRIILIFIR